MSEIEDIAGTEFDKLLWQRVRLTELDVVDWRISQRLEMSKELLGVVSVPADDALTTSGMPREVSRTVFRDQTSFVRGCSHLGVW